MKISKFAIPFERGGCYFLYNTSTQSLLKIDLKMYRLFLSAARNEVDIKKLPDDFVDFLKKRQFLDDDKGISTRELCMKMEYRKRYESFNNKRLALVIAPTLACNFACPYCYESNLPTSLMTEEVENNIIHFINSFEKKCEDLELCWEGGEPLIGFKVIQSLLRKIEEHSSLKLKSHLIVTNGYLLTPEICNYFQEKKLNLAQITIDGSAETHNKSRILKSGGPTYDTILQNIDLLAASIPDCKIIIRTNIHNGNKREYGDLYATLSKRWKGKNVHISPSFVLANDNCKVSCCSPHEKSEFYLELMQKHHIKNNYLVPKLNVGRCSATAENSYIIDPNGNLYKCWNDIGLKEYCIGNVAEGIKNNALIAKYVIGSDKYTDEKCLDCKLFPICEGGCNRHRIDNLELGTNYDLCSFDEEGLCDNLYEYYKMKSHEI